MKKITVTCLFSLLLFLMLVAPGFAASFKKNIEVSYNDIQIVVNGIRIVPRDVNGTIVEPFIYNGTTYLPVRAVSEALGNAVEWDPTTYTVYVSERPNANNQEQAQAQTPAQTQQPTEPLTQPPAEQAAQPPTETPTQPQTGSQTQPPTENQTQPPTESQPPDTPPPSASEIIVYVSNASDTIHSVYNCSGMKNYREMTLAEARKISSSYCSKCASHLQDVE